MRDLLADLFRDLFRDHSNGILCRLIDSAIKGTKWFCISVICTSILSRYILIRQIYPASGFWCIVTDVVTRKNRILVWHRDSQANEAVRQTISFVSVVTVTPGFITISRGMRNHFNSVLRCYQCRYCWRRKITLTKHWQVRNTLFLVLSLIAWNSDFHAFSSHCTDELIKISLKLSQCRSLQKLQNNFFAVNYQKSSISLTVTFSSNYSKTSSIDSIFEFLYVVVVISGSKSCSVSRILPRIRRYGFLQCGKSLI